jgi:hypothetical protein
LPKGGVVSKYTLEQVIKFVLGESGLDDDWFGDKPAGRAPFWWRKHLREAWNASNRTQAITQPESNEHKPSALPLGDAGKLVEALERLRDAANDSDDAHYGTLSTSFVRDIAEQALSTHIAGTSKGYVTP